VGKADVDECAAKRVVEECATKRVVEESRDYRRCRLGQILAKTTPDAGGEMAAQRQ